MKKFKIGDSVQLSISHHQSASGFDELQGWLSPSHLDKYQNEIGIVSKSGNMFTTVTWPDGRCWMYETRQLKKVDQPKANETMTLEMAVALLRKEPRPSASAIEARYWQAVWMIVDAYLASLDIPTGSKENQGCTFQPTST